MHFALTIFLLSRQFAEAVAKKLLFAQKAIKDQNCNFSSFENSGQDLVNEVSLMNLVMMMEVMMMIMTMMMEVVIMIMMMIMEVVMMIMIMMTKMIMMIMMIMMMMIMMEVLIMISITLIYCNIILYLSFSKRQTN